ncbi:MAG: DNA alkylation repair protein [Bacilli bacterium]|nr:DNA alkylation repair protein [Bacilli bacterium]
MKLDSIAWNEENYKKFVDYLYSLQDLNYREFHNKLNKNTLNLIGIRTPLLKNIAKVISKGNYLEFIKINKHSTYEEIIIEGLVIGYIKSDFKSVLELVNNFIPLIDNWAVNDVVCANLKCFKKYQKEGFVDIKKYLSSSNPWSIRFGIVLLLDHYINDDYINELMKIIKSIKNTNYYVTMANAWLISICFIKYPDITINLFINNELDNETNNKAIKKIKESLRVDKKTKLFLSNYIK